MLIGSLSPGMVPTDLLIYSSRSEDQAKWEKSKAFYEKYHKTYGKEIQGGHGPAPSYESVYILKEAIERAGSLSADAVVAELAKTDRDGVMGRIKYDPGHQAVYGFNPKETGVSAVVQWTADGRRVIVFPGSIAEAIIQLPPGSKSLK